MSFQDNQNPGIGGINQLTASEIALLQSLNSLGVPSNNVILGWDNTDSLYVNILIGSGLTYTHSTHTLSSSSSDSTKLAILSNLSDLNSASSARTNLGLGTLATQSGTFSGTSSGTNTGDQTNISGNAGTASAVAVGGITGLGTGVATALAINVGTDGAFVVKAGALGTPSSGTLTNCTGLPAASVVAGTLGSGTFTTTQLNYTNNAITATSNAATVPITSRLSTVTNNSAATLTITITTASAVDGQLIMVRILDSSAAAQTIAWVNTENSTVTAPTTSNGSTTLPLTVGFQYNSGTSKWRCIASA